MRKGFTLFELLGVIVIITAISLIAIPKVNDYIEKSREALYIDQVEYLTKNGQKWATDNIDKLDKYHINDTFITLQMLKDFEYLSKDDILNPKTKEIMDGCIFISYDENKYNFEYLELDCSSTSVDLSEYSNAYVVYDTGTSTENGDVVKTVSKVNSTNEKFPAYQTILSQNSLKVLGENVDGLYDFENEYVFRGNNVNNYVKYQNKEWRILSIDKNDYSMKLISTTSVQAVLSSTNTIDFTKTTLQNTLSDSVSAYTKILDKWNNGVVNDNGSFDSLRILLDNDSITSKVGLISLYDYATASLDSSCEDNYNNANCKNNNYVATMFSGKDFWTMNTNGEKFWYISKDNAVSLSDASVGLYYYALVIKVPINVYCDNSDTATGSSSTFAYNLK